MASNGIHLKLLKIKLGGVGILRSACFFIKLIFKNY